jgi:hypothetical protein
MSDTFKKIDKEYCITDDSVNVYEYRCLTAGFQIDEVKKNPIGYLMHNRDKGVVVRWEDFRIDGDKVFAKPVVNLSHPEGQSIVNQIEGGFLNAASVGKIVVLEASDAKNLRLPGQTKPTVTKWFPREISLVDIPGNYNALANLYDKDNNELNLSDLKNFIIKNNMSNTLDAAKILAALNLKDGDEPEVLAAITNLVEKANKADEYKETLAEKETELKTVKAETITKEVKDLIAGGKASKKLTNELATKLEKDYAENPSGLKDLIDTMPAQVLVTEQKDNSKYEGKTFDDLYSSGELENVKNDFPDLYDKLRDAKYPHLKQD